MEWIPIDCDENGFATDKCTKEALKQLPIVIRGYDELGEYHHLLTEDSLECDKMAIFKYKKGEELLSKYPNARYYSVFETDFYFNTLKYERNKRTKI